jgi:hypothetical protein
MGLIGLDGIVSDVALDLRDCLEAALGGEPDGVRPAEVCFVPGSVGEDFLSIGLSEDKCCSGFAWVRVDSIAPQSPQPGEEIGPCGIYTWAVTLEMGVARCAPVGDQYSGPSCTEWTEVALAVQQDAAAMRRAWCCWQPLIASGRTSVGPWQPFGPQGGCTGGTMQVVAFVDGCECSEEAA